MNEVNKKDLIEGQLYIAYRWHRGSYKEIAPFTITFNTPYAKTMLFKTEKYLSIDYESPFIVNETPLDFYDDLAEESDETIFFELKLEEALDFFDFV